MDTAPVFQPYRSKYFVVTRDIFLPAFICLCVMVLIYGLLYSPLFKIQFVACTLDFEPCLDSSVLAELEKLKGQNILLLNKQTVTKRLESSDFTIREATLKRELPGKINIELDSIYPVSALQVKNSGTWAVFDAELQFIATRMLDPNVPTLIITRSVNLVVGQVPQDANIVHALELARRLGDELYSFKSLELIDADTLELSLSDGRLAIFTPHKDEMEQLTALLSVLSDATMKDEGRIIDVRFAQPVLRP